MRFFTRHLRYSWAAGLLLMGVVLPTRPLVAQETTQPSPEGEAEIIVTGQRNGDDIINTYVKALTAANANNPLARYASGDYCPVVLGPSPTSKKQIITRLRKVAAAAGVKPADEDCAPSALVIFTDDKDAFLEKFRARHPQYFQQLRGAGRHLTTAEGPAVVWHLVEHVPTGIPSAGGLLFSAVTPLVAMSVVVLERSAVVGFTTTQVADYILMRTLTDQEPRALSVPSDFTILRALHAPTGSAVPLSLTEWDLAYLKGRYAGNPARHSGKQTASIRAAMRRALTETAIN